MTRTNLSLPRLESFWCLVEVLGVYWEHPKHIPTEFTRQCDGFGHRRKLILEDLKGRSWPVHLCKRMVKYGSLISIGKGWLQFARGSKLEVGDRCIFTVVSESAEMVMQVEKI
ncbi:B3 domain-containing protein Os01g0723500-like [Asparagus officinalis]|uniref:B3 domain-containing protein Os01g0723500-like n=1 Tax=Asparagus officinalis TaxID=4686 RepID=UPI00098E6594|nr:B3 domain-containing protein Os01g0723500-like [Asparagus officinalis]